MPSEGVTTPTRLDPINDLVCFLAQYQACKSADTEVVWVRDGDGLNQRESAVPHAYGILYGPDSLQRATAASVDISVDLLYCITVKLPCYFFEELCGGRVAAVSRAG